MAYHIQTRVEPRVLMATSSIGLIIMAAMGSAWLGATLAREASVHDQAQRLVEVAAQAYGKDHFLNMSAMGIQKPKGGDLANSDDDSDAVDRSAMAIAMRYDPSSAPQTLGHERSDIILAQNLITLKSRDRANTPRNWGHMQSAPSASPQIVEASLTLGAFDKPPVQKLKLASAAAPFGAKGANRNDADCLAQAVYYEARGEGEQGMRAVAQVILNRVRHPAFPKTICGVVYQGSVAAAGNHSSSCQFSFACDGTTHNRMEAFAWKRAQSVASDALSGYVMKAVGTSTHFHTTYVNPQWADRMDRITAIGDHVFYQFRGSGSRLTVAANKIQPSTDGPQVSGASSLGGNTGDNAELIRAVDHQVQPAVKTVQLEQTIKGAEAREIVQTLAAPAPVTQGQ